LDFRNDIGLISVEIFITITSSPFMVLYYDWMSISAKGSIFYANVLLNRQAEALFGLCDNEA